MLHSIVFAQNTNFKYTTQTIKPSTVVVLHSGSQTWVGGTSRQIVEVKLPPNTVSWYFSYGAYTEAAQAQKSQGMVGLAAQLLKLVDNTGISTIAVNQLLAPSGSAYCDIAFFDAYEQAKRFEDKTDYNLLGEGFQMVEKYSVKNHKSGIVKIEDKKYLSGTFYLGLRNPVSFGEINLMYEIAAVVQETVINKPAEKTKDQIIAEKTSQLKKLSLEKKHPEAAELCKQLIDLGQNQFYAQLGWNLILSKQYTQALKYLEKGASIDAHDLYIQGNLAHAYLLTNEYDQAKAIYQKYLNQNVGFNYSWLEMIKNDLQTLEQNEIKHDDFKKVKKLLKL
ncbi:MAG: tetratricopeptide repeat protein [Microscillaceae bacterium]|nr:tetratricopeptide repeat protein [Microscillaceae bacterium]